MLILTVLEPFIRSFLFQKSILSTFQNVDTKKVASKFQSFSQSYLNDDDANNVIFAKNCTIYHFRNIHSSMNGKICTLSMVLSCLVNREDDGTTKNAWFLLIHIL